MQNALVCIDLSPVTDKVAAYAAALGAATRCTVHLLHVAEPEPEFVGHDPDTQEHRDVVARKLREAHRGAEAVADGLRARGATVTLHVLRGSTADKILEAAATTKADVIVVGSSGHNLLRSLFIGSVADALLRRATVPVTVVPVRDVVA